MENQNETIVETKMNKGAVAKIVAVGAGIAAAVAGGVLYFKKKKGQQVEEVELSEDSSESEE